MKNFDKIIKEKVGGFEVPFNEAHWAEMEAKLNRIHSKKKNTFLLGGAATVITLLISAYFLTPSLSNINEKNQTQVKELSTPTKTKILSPKIKEKTKNNKIEPIVKAEPNKLVLQQEKEDVFKPTQLSTPNIIAEKPQTTNKEDLVSNNNLKKEIEQASPEKKTTTLPTVNTIPKSIVKTPKEIPAASTSKIKTIRHKAYEDENVSKKSLKRKRGNFFRFLSFKKKLYKVPLARKKRKKKKR